MSLTGELLEEVMRDWHRYAPGIEPHQAALNDTSPTLRRRLLRGAHRSRDLIERGAARAGFTRQHRDPRVASATLERILALRDGLEHTSTLLGDEASRRAVIDVLKLRVLGPYHAPLAVTPDGYRAMQSQVDRELRREHGTFAVADPWFSPLSRYEVPDDGHAPVSVHAHSVDIVSVFLLDQYSYTNRATAITAQPGDVVLDVGGCWGDTALYFASRVGPEGRVYTFEFDPANLEIMRVNLALNPALAPRIEIVEKALWDQTGAHLSFTPGGRTTALSPAPTEAALQTETITLDDYIEQAGLPRIDFVKMDVEGAELRVLAGARNLLGRQRPRLALACYHRDDDLVRIPQAIAAADPSYRCFVKTSSPLEDETVLFASVAPRTAAEARNRT